MEHLTETAQANYRTISKLISSSVQNFEKGSTSGRTLSSFCMHVIRFIRVSPSLACPTRRLVKSDFKEM